MTHINFDFLEEEKTMFGSAMRMLALQKSNGTIEKDYQMHFRSGLGPRIFFPVVLRFLVDFCAKLSIFGLSSCFSSKFIQT